MEFSIGQVVFSKAGRDKGCAFVIVNIDGEYLHLVDGKLRPMENPKKKKAKHLQPTKAVDAPLKQAIESGQSINGQLKNADFRSVLARFERERKEDSHG